MKSIYTPQCPHCGSTALYEAQPECFVCNECFTEISGEWLRDTVTGKMIATLVVAFLILGSIILTIIDTMSSFQIWKYINGG